MNQLMQKKELTVFGDGKQTRAFSYIADVAKYIANVVDYPRAYNQVFNIGADKEFTINQLTKQVMLAMGLESKIKYLPGRNEAKYAYADHAKAQKVFSINSYTPLEEGISRMATWAKKVGSRKTKKFKNIEIYKNLPKAWLYE